jgi:hypothetical protein
VYSSADISPCPQEAVNWEDTAYDQVIGSGGGAEWDAGRVTLEFRAVATAASRKAAEKLG